MGLFSKNKQTTTRVEPTLNSTHEQVEKQFNLAYPTAANSFMLGATYSNTGTPITPLTALQLTPAYACIRILAQDISKLTFKVQQLNADNNVVDLPRHPFLKLLHYPNEHQTGIDFWASVVVNHQLKGNAFIYLKRDAINGDVKEMFSLSPEQVSVLTSDGEYYYEFSHPLIGYAIKCNSMNMVHIKNISLDGGFMGIPPLMLAQDSVGTGIAAQSHAATVFRQGTYLSGIIEVPKKLSAEAWQRLKQMWQGDYSGTANSSKIAVLEESHKFTPLSVSPMDMQLLDSRKFSIQECSRIWRVPLTKLADLGESTQNNIEALEQSYVNETLVSIARNIEDALERVLLTKAERGILSIRFDFDKLLRADLKTRMETYGVGLNFGIYSVNEVRKMESMPSVEGGDIHRFPLNQTAPIPESTPREQTGES